jgi:hypothetical protein
VAKDDATPERCETIRSKILNNTKEYRGLLSFKKVLPKRRPSFVNGWSVPTGNNAGFVSVMADNVWFRQTTRPSGHTVVFQIPFSHLLKIQFFIGLVGGPGHVKNVGIRGGISRQHFFHLILGAMIFHASRKGIGGSLFPYLDPQSPPTDVVVQQGRQGGLMTGGSCNEIAMAQQHSKKVLRVRIAPDKIKTYNTTSYRI